MGNRYFVRKKRGSGKPQLVPAHLAEARKADQLGELGTAAVRRSGV